jgi:hypothetical protein
MLLSVKIPHEPFNAKVRDGSAGAIMAKIVEDAKPEAVYFTEEDGHRCAVMVINVENASQVPVFAEPAGLEELGKKWA